MPGILGKKIGMTSIHLEDGSLAPVTVIEAGPCQILRIKTKDTDGYEAITLGFGEKKDKKVNKPLRGFYKKNSLKAAAVVREFKNFENAEELKVGENVNTEIFDEGEKVKVTGLSKGKGFQGVMRRHGFGGVGGTTHGQGDRLRAPGSIGQSSYPSRVFKGTRMAGRMGNNKTTTRNLKIVKIVPEKNIIMIKGSVPGAVNSIIEINK